TITFADTGLQSTIAERLLIARKYLDDNSLFLANYADGVADVDLHQLVAFHEARKATATFVSVRPTQMFHSVEVRQDGSVKRIERIDQTSLRMNGGYFVMSPDIFDYINRGEELVEEPFGRLISKKRLIAYRHDGFWACMDTTKEKVLLDDMCSCGDMPWCVWREHKREKR
ncbi:MAG: glucose-1-phosphate cytidylyltransferase, partial [Planctomycetota bacterium]